MTDREFLESVWRPDLLEWKDGEHVTVWVPEYEIPYFNQGISGAAHDTRERIHDLENLKEEIGILEEKSDPLYGSKPFNRIIERLQGMFSLKAEGIRGYDPDFERKEKLYREQPGDRD